MTVEDTEDGGVLVRAKVGVAALSPTARVVYDALEDGSALAAELVERTGKSKDSVTQAISELRKAGLADGAGPIGKAHTYWRTDQPPNGDTYSASQVGRNNGAKGGHLLRLMGQQGFTVLGPAAAEGDQNA